MKHYNRTGESLSEPGTPFLSFSPDEYTGAPSLRVMPSGFSYPSFPAACTFVRDLGSENISVGT